MYVYCFTVQIPVGSNVDIDTIHREFGVFSPKYLPLEGGDYMGPQYLCCVNKKIDIIGICKKYGAVCKGFSLVEIDDIRYNNSYTIYPSYSTKDDEYVLRMV
jgi:hypothetical protein